MEFRLLGRVEAEHDGRRIALGRRRERCLLGILLLEAEAVVLADRLIDLLWDGDPPANARPGLHTHVARLRTCLNPDNTGHTNLRLTTRDGGYVVEVDRQLVDAHRFATLVDRAMVLSEPARRADLLRQAVALWRGPLLADVASGRLRDRVGGPLTQLRMTATEAMVDAELACGRHGELIGELTAMTAEHPHRERFYGQLMLALYRAGRHPEALDMYQRLRTRLVDDLGVDPGPQLRQLYTAILRHDPDLAAPRDTGATGHDIGATHVATAAPGIPTPTPAPAVPVGPPVPAQLPADVAGFTGRTTSMARLDALLSAAGEGQTAAVAISVIVGAAGVGKTALAVHWAHRVRDQFRDGQLYVDLRGHEPGRAARPIAALAHLLRALGVVPEQVPLEVEAAAGMYRSLLADRRVLVVLDNAASAEQVRPLLPGTPGCFVLVTSRDNLPGLVARDGAYRLGLDVLTP